MVFSRTIVKSSTLLIREFEKQCKGRLEPGWTNSHSRHDFITGWGRGRYVNTFAGRCSRIMGADTWPVVPLTPLLVFFGILLSGIG